jgi:hypothetical protein
MKGKRSPSLVGQTFGKWTVIERLGYRGRATVYLCRCVCGREKPVPRGNLLRGRSKSCGFHRESINRTHGMSDTPVYRAWMNKRHGGGVGGRWAKFENYIEDAKKHVGEHAVRMDLSKPFTPENCKWMSPSEATRHINSIYDEFTPLAARVSRQRIYQLRRRKEGRCIRCARISAGGKSLCKSCREKDKARQAKQKMEQR